MAKATSNSKPVSPLAEYLISVLYNRWSSDRRDLEEKWERNDCTIRRIRQEDWKKGEGEDWRSNNSIGVIKQKWLTGCALVLDHILQGGQLNGGLKVDELSMNLNNESLDQHTDDIDQATKHIRTQLTLGCADKETIKAVFAGGKYGIAWGQYNVDTVHRVEYVPVEYEFAVDDPEDQRFEKVVHQIDIPVIDWVPCWEMFWDMTEDDIRKGDGLCRERNISPYMLREFAEQGDGWIQNEINSVIDEAKSNKDHQSESNDDNVAPGRRYLEYYSNSIKYREFRCRVPKKVIMDYDKSYLRDKAPDFDAGFDTIDETDGREQECLVVLANNVVVRFLPVDDETDLRKYYMVKWEDDLDHYHGVGIADNGYQVQEILNGAFNAFQDNKKLVGDVQGFYNPMYFKDDEDMTIQPGKFRPTNEVVKSMSDAVHQLQFTDTGDSLIAMIRLAQEFADDETNIPKMAQGAVGPITPQTAYEASQLMEKSGKYIASVIRNYDNGWTEPIYRDFFDYNMMDPNNNTGQGNFVATANGFTSYQDQVVRVQKLMQLLGMVLNQPTLENMIRVMKLMEEVLKANDIDPDEVMYTQEEYQENMMRDQEAAMAASQQEQDPEKDELEKEKLSAEIDKIERDQNREDDKLELERRKYINEQRQERQRYEQG